MAWQVRRAELQPFDLAANSLVAVRRMGVWRRVPREPQLHAQGVCQVMFALPRTEGAPPSDWRRHNQPRVRIGHPAPHARVGGCAYG